MIAMARSMLTCRWTARRLQRYLDADPSAALTPDEVTRLVAHVQGCTRCARVIGEYRMLGTAFARWSSQRMSDPDAVERLNVRLEEILRGDHA